MNLKEIDLKNGYGLTAYLPTPSGMGTAITRQSMDHYQNLLKMGYQPLLAHDKTMYFYTSYPLGGDGEMPISKLAFRQPYLGTYLAEQGIIDGYDYGLLRTTSWDGTKYVHTWTTDTLEEHLEEYLPSVSNVDKAVEAINGLRITIYDNREKAYIAQLHSVFPPQEQVLTALEDRIGEKIKFPTKK